MDLKREFLRLLDEDEEFRYAVAGRIGILEILKRLDRLEENQNKLLENINRLWEEVRDLRKAYQGLSRRVSVGFAELGSALGVTYEIHAAAYIQLLLEELGYPGVRVGRGWAVKDGQVLEMDIFCEDPLVVGEVTSRLRDEAEMNSEIIKLLERVEAVSSKYGKKPFMTVLSVGVASENLVEKLRAETEKHNIKLILGREIEEELSA